MRHFIETENEELLNEPEARGVCEDCFSEKPGSHFFGCDEEFGDCWLLKEVTGKVDLILSRYLADHSLGAGEKDVYAELVFRLDRAFDDL